MSFLDGHWLALLVVVASLAAAYVWIQVRGRRQAAVRFTNLALLGSVAPRSPGWRRHVAAALLLLSLAAMVVALARPTREVQVARERSAVMMAIDVSISMQATDVAPSRLAAAQAAAVDFADSLPGSVQLGLVSFAGTATVLVPPTTDHELVVRAVGALELAEATAIGDAVLASLATLRATTADARSDEPVPASVVLMSDGETTVGTPTLVAADAAREAGVPVTTIAFGTDRGTVVYERQLVPVPVNRQELAALAEETGGQAFTALTGDELRAAYEDIGSIVGYEQERREVTTVVVAVAFALGVLAAAAALRWTSRLP